MENRFTLPAPAIPANGAIVPDTSYASSYQPGNTLEGSKYRLVRLLGYGSFAEVWLAIDTADASEVAIKIRHRGHTHPDIARRFLQEKQIAQRLGKSDHVVMALTYLRKDGDEGYDAIVLEYIEGGRTLRDVINEGTASPREALRLISDILKGLVHTHGKGVIHRDLKPENILLNPKTDPPTAMLNDFGLNYASGDGPRATTVQMVMGTPAYMAGEMAMGAVLATERSDLCAVGIMLGELFGVAPLVTGKTPKEVAPMNVPTRVAAWVAQINAERVRAIVERATLVEYDQASGEIIRRRYPSAEAMLRDVEALMADPPKAEYAAGRPPPPSEPRAVAVAEAPSSANPGGLQPWETRIEMPPTGSTGGDIKSDPFASVVRPQRQLPRGVIAGIVAALVAVIGGGAWALWPEGTSEVVAETPVEAVAEPAPEPTPVPAVETPPDLTPPVAPPTPPPPAEVVAVKTENPKPPPGPTVKKVVDPKPSKAEVKPPPTPEPPPPPVETPKATAGVSIVKPQAQAKVGDTITIHANVTLPEGATTRSVNLYWHKEGDDGPWQPKSVTLNGNVIETTLLANAGLGNSVRYYIDVRTTDGQKFKSNVTTTAIAP